MGVRSFIPILMNFVLALTFLQAPFLHVHEHESTEHHPHGFFHTHFPHHHHHLSASKSVELRDLDPDDDAVFQQWFSATLGDLSTPVFIPTFIYTAAPARSSEPFVELNIRSGHDPPRLSRARPRSPLSSPASLLRCQHASCSDVRALTECPPPCTRSTFVNLSVAPIRSAATPGGFYESPAGLYR
jgi:hypothetical protein